VASAAGNSAEIAKWTGGGIIVNSKKMPYGRVAVNLNDAILQISKLAYNPRGRRALGKAAHHAWEQKYTWEILAKRYEKLYLDLLKQ
jgi:glycosyltransferase involved in cell wall biosynthesis